MALFEDMVKSEIEALNLVCDDESIIEQMEKDIENALVCDAYLWEEVVGVVDVIINSYDLPSIDDEY